MTRGGAAGYLRPHAGVPAGVVAAPQLQVPGGNQRIQHVVLVVHVEGVGEVLWLAGGVGGRGGERHTKLSDQLRQLTQVKNTTFPNCKLV